MELMLSEIRVNIKNFFNFWFDKDSNRYYSSKKVNFIDLDQSIFKLSFSKAVNSFTLTHSS